jgi:hypothetical protein
MAMSNAGQPLVQVMASVLPTGAATATAQATTTTAINTLSSKVPAGLTVNGSGELQVTGGSTQHAEGSLHTSAELGNMALGVRRDAGTAISSDSAYAPMLFNSNGALWVHSEAAATAAAQATNTSAVTAVGAQLPATLGQAAAAGSMSVVLASNQAALPLSTGASSESKQDAHIAQGAPTSIYQHQALSNTAVSAVGATAVVKRVLISNATGTGAFMRMYDNASAAALGTDTPDICLYIPAQSVQSLEINTTFANGISLAATASPGDAATDAGGPLIVQVLYQ